MFHPYYEIIIKKEKYLILNIKIKLCQIKTKRLLGIGDWGLGIGDWGLGVGANTPKPKTQTPKPKTQKKEKIKKKKKN